MQGIQVARRAPWRAALLAAVAAALTLGSPAGVAAEGTRAAPLAEHGVKALEKLPWETHILRANLSTGNPVAVEGCYLMSRQILVVSASGKVYCFDRRNLEPRWVHILKYPLAKPPAEGAGDYVFLMKDAKGSYWALAIRKRTGAVATRFPVRLPFAASSGIDANNALLFVGSLGRPGNNRTLETVNLVSGRSGWGYRSTGLVWGSPTLDPEGDIVVIAADNGAVTALSAKATAPRRPLWTRDLGGFVKSSTAVTPEHVLVGNSDGVFYNLDLFSGEVKWLAGLEAPITETPWVFGAYETVTQSSGVEGAAPVEVRRYEGIAFVRNRLGTHAFDLRSGTKLFTCKKGERPLLRHGKYILTSDRERRVSIRDAKKDYEVVGRLNLGMFDLIPTNRSGGQLFAVTADGGFVAALSR